MSVIAPFLVMGGLWLALTYGPATIVAALKKIRAQEALGHAAQLLGALVAVAGGVASPVRAVVLTVVCAAVGKALWRRNAAAVLGGLLGYAGAAASTLPGVACILGGAALTACGVLAVRRRCLSGPVRRAVQWLQGQRASLHGVRPVLPSLPVLRARRIVLPGPSAEAAATDAEMTDVEAETIEAEMVEAEAETIDDEVIEAETTEVEEIEVEAIEVETLEAVEAPSHRATPRPARRAAARKAARPEDEEALAKLRSRRTATSDVTASSEPASSEPASPAPAADPTASHGDEVSSEEIDKAFAALKEMFDRS
jgi:hypothetical protein